MKFWQQLSDRDRKVLLIGAALVALMLLWALVWDPMTRSRQDLRVRVASAEKDYVWMLGAAERLKRLAPGGNASTFDRAGKSLLALADQAAKEAQLANAIQRMEPSSNARVNVWLENADFDQVAVWLEQLEIRYGIRVESFQFDRGAQTGWINGRLSLLDSVSSP